MASQTLLSKTETRKRLGIGCTRYEYFIRQGILPKPILIGKREYHTEAQIQIAENNLDRQALKNYVPASGAPKMKPLSERHKREFAD